MQFYALLIFFIRFDLVIKSLCFIICVFTSSIFILQYLIVYYIPFYINYTLVW